MNAQASDITDKNSTESYQSIQDEHLSGIIIDHQVLAGSKIALSTYNKVVFSESGFYACEFQGVTFTNCVFEDCNFNFSHFKKCNFINCSFVNCKKMATTSQNCVYENCEFEPETSSWVDETCNTVKSLRHDHTTDIYIELMAA
jgi:uncharacterized protein YjbI with pentapeptide repeats